jgi:hypothetical protein
MLGFSSLALAAEMREWVDKSGKFRIEAELVKVTDKEVELRKADGKIVTVPIEKLSDSDRKYVEASSSDNSDETPSEPLESLVRVVVPAQEPDRGQQELVAVGCALEIEGEPNPVVLTSRTLLPTGLTADEFDQKLASSKFLHLRTDKTLGSAARLGFPRPESGNLKSYDALIVLTTDQKSRIPALRLASKEPAEGDIVRLPLLPPAQGKARSPKPPIKWTKWKVERFDQLGMYLQPVDGEFPSTGVLPIIDEEDRVVGVYVRYVETSAGERLGLGNPLSDIQSALAKATMVKVDQGKAAGKNLFPGVMAIPQGPVDESAAWRTSYDEFVKTIKVTKGADGKLEFDWGEAQDFGAWYERCRVIGPKSREAMQGGEKRQELYRQLEPMVAEMKLAAERLQGVEWTAVAKQISLNPGASSEFDLAQPPKSFEIAFFAEKQNAGDWSQVRVGDKVRFSCRFEAYTASDTPPVDVYVTLKEVLDE